MPLKYARIDANAKNPSRKHPADAGVDVYALTDNHPLSLLIRQHSHRCNLRHPGRDDA